LLAVRDVVEHARNEAVFLEGPAVVGDRGIALGAAGDIAIEKLRQPRPGSCLEIVERKVAPQRARNRAGGAFNRRRRGLHFCGSIVHVGE
jgi:hypothetical protein